MHETSGRITEAKWQIPNPSSSQGFRLTYGSSLDITRDQSVDERLQKVRDCSISINTESENIISN